MLNMKVNSRSKLNVSFSEELDSLILSDEKAVLCTISLSKDSKPQSLEDYISIFFTKVFGINLNDNQLKVVPFMVTEYIENPSCLNCLEIECQKFADSFSKKIHFDLPISQVKEDIDSLVAEFRSSNNFYVNYIFLKYFGIDPRSITFINICDCCTIISNLFK